MHIRQMTITDYGAIYKLWIDTPGMGLNQQDDSLEGISKYLKHNPDTCFIAQEGKELIGVILSGHDGRRGFIYHLRFPFHIVNKVLAKSWSKQFCRRLNSKE